MSDRQSIRTCIEVVQRLQDDPQSVNEFQLEELLFLLDELNHLHTYLDEHDIPGKREGGFEMTISERTAYLLGVNQSLETFRKLYSQMLESTSAPRQFRLF